MSLRAAVVWGVRERRFSFAPRKRWVGVAFFRRREDAGV